MHPSLRHYVQALNPAIAEGRPDREVAVEAERALGDLLSTPDLLTEEQRRPNPDRYAQHLLYVHPEGAYSIVALVWLPGQRTPVHDHVCWCVTGVLQGREEEMRYELRDGADGPELVVRGAVLHEPGDVGRLVPPEENIHLVANACDGVAISLHVYGADISVLGSSVNKVFDHRISPSAAEGARSWRAAT
jgi:3-mercaptopropionate dioxygenase